MSWEVLARIWQEICNFTFKHALWEASWELLARIWQEIAAFTFKIALWEVSWEVLARVCQEIANFTFEIALWEASWGVLARIWQEIADFTFKIALWEAPWELLARIWQEIADFTFQIALWEASWELKLANLELILASQKHNSCMFYACSVCTAWVVLGWVVWVTVFVWGLRGGGCLGGRGLGNCLLHMPTSNLTCKSKKSIRTEAGLRSTYNKNLCLPHD